MLCHDVQTGVLWNHVCQLRGIVYVVVACVSVTAAAATFPVTKTSDTNDLSCDADCSLREAILAANASAGADTVTLPAGTFTLTIIGALEDLCATGDLDVTDDLEIVGSGSSATIISANGLGDRALHVISGVVEVRDLRIQGGFADGPIVSDRNGGGISNEDRLTVRDCVLLDNQADNGGGGISNYLGATLAVAGTVLSGGSAGGLGGGVYNFGGWASLSQCQFLTNASGYDGGAVSNSYSAAPPYGGRIDLNLVSFESNHAVRDGGAIWNGSWPSHATARDTTFLLNSADRSSGAIHNNGSLYVSGGSFSSNSAIGQGGAVRNWDTARFVGVEFTGNSAWGGGAISITSGNVAHVESCTFDSNFATNRFGGAIESDGTANIVRSLFVNNDSTARPDSLGGALYVGSSGMATVENSTFSANTAVAGGALYTFGMVTVRSSTIAGNSSSSSGSGIAVSASLGTADVANSIVAESTSGSDCAGPVTSSGYNLESATTCGFSSTGDLQNTTPLLDPLADLGGPTHTMGLQIGSPAIDGAHPNGCSDTSGVQLDFDQRGYARSFDGDGTSGVRCDIGAFELGSFLALIYAADFESADTLQWSSTVP